MAITNMSQLQNALMKKCYELVNEEKRYALTVFRNYINKFYSGYRPLLYRRTYQLMNALASTGVSRTTNGYKADIYYKVSALRYYEKVIFNGTLVYTRPHSSSMNRQIFEYAAYGMYYGYNPHGNYKGADDDTTIWKDPVTDIQIQMRPQLKRYLQSKGIKVK